MGDFGENYKGYFDRFWYAAPDCIWANEEGYRLIVEELLQLTNYPLVLTSLSCTKVEDGIEVNIVINNHEAKCLVDGSEYFNGELVEPINDILKKEFLEEKRRLFYISPLDYDVFVTFTDYATVIRMADDGVIWSSEEYLDYLSKF